jgi:hypothetical protein
VGSLLHSDGPLPASGALVAPATPATPATPAFASPSHLHSLLHELSPSTYLSPMPFPTSPDRDRDGVDDGDGDVSRLLPFATPRGAPPTPTTQLISVGGHSAGPGAGPSRSQSPISMRAPLGLRAETPLRKYRSVSRPPPPLSLSPSLSPSSNAATVHPQHAALKGHTSMVQCVAVLADQRRVVSGSLDRTLRLWLADGGQCLRTLRGHSGGVYCVALLPRGGAEDERVVSGSDDNTLRVWDAASGRALQTLRGHSDTVACVVTLALPTGAYVVSGSWDKTLRVWAGDAGVEGADLGQCLRVLPGHGRQVHCLAAVPTAAGGCSALVASGSWDRSVRLWDVLTGHCLAVLPGHSDYVLCLAALRVPLSLFDAAGTTTPAPPADDAAATAPVLVSGSIDRTLRFWRLDTLLAALAHAPPAAGQPSGSRSRSNSHGAVRAPRRSQLLDEGAAPSPSPSVVAAPVAPLVASCFHVHREPNAAVYCLAAYPFSPLAREPGAGAAAAVSFVSGSFYRALSLWQLDLADASASAAQTQHAPGSRFTSPSAAMASPLKLRSAASVGRARPGGSPMPPPADGHGAATDLWQWRLRQRQSLEGHKGTASCLAVFADGRIVSGSRDETLLLWAPLP